MTRRVLLHVGTPKTATSYLQDVLFRNRESLAEQRYHYPAHRHDAHFLAALDLMRLPWGGLEREAVGAWDRLAAEARAIGDAASAAGEDSTVVISHEILAHATRSDAGYALRTLGIGEPDTEIHLLVSARDLARQIPAEWQENIKHRATLSYAAFLTQLRDPERAGRIGSWFWRVQELPDILDRWGISLPPEHVHVITVPPPGADRDLLWKRFVHAFGLDGLDYDLGEEERANPSMGVAETAMVRRLNRRVNPVVEPVDYRPLVRELVVHQTLSQHRRSPKLTVPTELAGWVEDLSRTWVRELRERRYDVVGDLDDLVGETDAGGYADPDVARPRAVAGAAIEALEAMVVEAARLREVEGRLHHEVAEARRERDEARHAYERTLGHRTKRRLFLAMEHRRSGRLLIRIYRFLRRNSRSA